MISHPQDLLHDFVKVANLSGFDIDPTAILHEVLPAHHEPRRLLRGRQTVYVFSLAASGAAVLKVGRVSPRSNTRFLSRHYNPHSCKYNLAKSLLQNPETWGQLGISTLDEFTVGDWLKTHTARDHFYLDAKQSTLLLSLLEVFMQGRLRPLFEG